MEILDLHSDDIVDHFEEYILYNHERIALKVEEPREAEEEDYPKNRQPLDGYLTWSSYEEASDLDDNNE